MTGRTRGKTRKMLEIYLIIWLEWWWSSYEGWETCFTSANNFIRRRTSTRRELMSESSIAALIRISRIFLRCYWIEIEFLLSKKCSRLPQPSYFFSFFFLLFLKGYSTAEEERKKSQHHAFQRGPSIPDFSWNFNVNKQQETKICFCIIFGKHFSRVLCFCEASKLPQKRSFALNSFDIFCGREIIAF